MDFKKSDHLVNSFYLGELIEDLLGMENKNFCYPQLCVAIWGDCTTPSPPLLSCTSQIYVMSIYPVSVRSILM
jgi:hypothetical protein